MESEEKIFQHLVPLWSALGREFAMLRSERNHHRMAFETAKDKMAFDTSALRCSEIALSRFLSDMIPMVQQHKIQQEKVFKSTSQVERRSERIIWTRHAIESYKSMVPKGDKRKLKMYHPSLWQEVGRAWKEFKDEIKRWQGGQQPFDGSQAMSKMMFFQVKVRLLASANA